MIVTLRYKSNNDLTFVLLTTLMLYVASSFVPFGFFLSAFHLHALTSHKSFLLLNELVTNNTKVVLHEDVEVGRSYS